MKSKMLVDEFVDLIDGYKVDKITKLINGDSASKNPITKKGIKGFLNDLNTKNKEKFKMDYSNALDPVNLCSVKQLLAEIYSFDFSKDFQEWAEYQNSEEYKSKSLRVKIANKVKKAITDQETKDQVNKILNKYKLDYNLDSALEIIKQGLSDDNELLESIEEEQITWFQALNDINEKYDYANWLDEKSNEAKNVGFATHIAKLTHSGISDASNVYFDRVNEGNYLSTSSLKNREIEISIIKGGNALAPIGKLLQLQNGNVVLSEQLKNGNLVTFERFAKNDEQLSRWRKGFLAVFSEKGLATHYLAKQIYFPINNNDHCDEKNYHLINPMMSSSLDQVIFEKINFTKPRYSKKAVEIRKQKREEKFHQDIQESYPNLAILKVTSGDKTSKAHMNVSPLNIKRVGGRYLFPSMPPTWQKIPSPPLKQKSLFEGEFEKRSWRSVKELQKYLIKLQNKEFGNKATRDQVKQHINNIINILFDYVLEVQAMPSGWSEQAKLKEIHALWLDSNRDDKAFQAKRKSSQWQDDICQDFGLWMNRKLSTKEMKLVQFEQSKWAKLLQNRLNLFDKGWEESK